MPPAIQHPRRRSGRCRGAALRRPRPARPSEARLTSGTSVTGPWMAGTCRLSNTRQTSTYHSPPPPPYSRPSLPFPAMAARKLQSTPPVPLVCPASHPCPSRNRQNPEESLRRRRALREYIREDAGVDQPDPEREARARPQDPDKEASAAARPNKDLGSQ